MPKLGKIAKRRWNRNEGLILEKTLDGNIRITNAERSMLTRSTIDVEDGLADLTDWRPEKCWLRGTAARTRA